MRRQCEFLQLPFCNLATLSINSLVKIRFNLESGGCHRTPDEPEHHIEIAQRLACPVHTDVAEEPVFYRIPFGARRRVMTQGDRQRERLPHLVCQCLFPSAKNVSVTSP